jgi:hypothetical protein
MHSFFANFVKSGDRSSCTSTSTRTPNETRRVSAIWCAEHSSPRAALTRWWMRARVGAS